MCVYFVYRAGKMLGLGQNINLVQVNESIIVQFRGFFIFFGH